MPDLATRFPNSDPVIAIEQGTKSRVCNKLSEDHKALQKKELFSGHAKTF